MTRPAGGRSNGKSAKNCACLLYTSEHRPGQYNALLLSEKLWTYLADLNEQADDRLACIVSQMQEAEGVTEELKARDQWEVIEGCHEAIVTPEEWEQVQELERAQNGIGI